MTNERFAITKAEAIRSGGTIRRGKALNMIHATLGEQFDIMNDLVKRIKSLKGEEVNESYILEGIRSVQLAEELAVILDNLSETAADIDTIVRKAS